MVRCSNCGQLWKQVPPAGPSLSAQELAPPAAEMAERQAAPERPSPAQAEGAAAAEEAVSGPAESESAGEAAPEPAPEEEKSQPPQEAAGEPEAAPAEAPPAAPAKQPAEEGAEEPAGEGTGELAAEGAGEPTETEPPPPGAAELEELLQAEPIPSALTGAAGSGGAGRARKRAGWIGAIAVVAVLAMTAAGLVLAREPIIAAFPPAADIYAALGLAEKVGAGLDILNVTSARANEGEEPAVVVKGLIANVAETPRPVPLIRVALLDGKGEELRRIEITPDAEVLAPGARMAFTARVTDPPATARRIKVTFAPRRAKEH